MANLDGISRVGRSQGASIFWGLVSVFFAAAACFYYWKNQGNETSANVLRGQVLNLQELNESLTAQKEKLQAGISETTNQLKAREDFLQDKETKLAAEESRIETLQQKLPQTQTQAPAPATAATPTQAAVIKKFNDAIHKLDKDAATEVIERNGRPVLRVPNASLFAPGESALMPEGKALLNQIALAMNNQLDGFELRIVTYSDTDMDVAKPAKDGAEAKSHFASCWDLTSARSTAISRYFRDQTQLPFPSVLVLPRGDSDPIVPNAKEGHVRNRRVEITIVPVPVAFQASATTAPLEPPPDPPAPAKKPKEPKAKDKDKDKAN